MTSFLDILPDRAWLVVAVVFVVCALQLFGKRIEERRRGARPAAGILGVAFMAMVSFGVMDLGNAGALTFRGLSLFLAGGAAIFILACISVASAMRTNKSAEERRVLAQDL